MFNTVIQSADVSAVDKAMLKWSLGPQPSSAEVEKSSQNDREKECRIRVRKHRKAVSSSIHQTQFRILSIGSPVQLRQIVDQSKKKYFNRYFYDFSM